MKNFTEVATLAASGVFFYVRPTCCAYHNICMTLGNIWGYSKKKFTSYKCVYMINSNELRNNFFTNSHLTACFVTLGQNEGGLYMSPWNHERWVHKEYTKLNMVSVFGI